MSSKNDKNAILPAIGERVLNGLVKENPTFVLLLGMCPTLAVTTSAMNGFGMGATTLVVLALSNLMISALRKIIPDKIRIPAFIVIIASFVTIVELLLKAYIPSLYDALGLYIPLIVVNCIILGRAEAYAYSNPVLPSLFDGIGMGLGFTFALTLIGAFREILGAGEVFGTRIMPNGYTPISIFVMAPGAFFVLAMLTAIQNAVKIAGTKRGKDMSKIQSGCGGNCMECNKECKVTVVEADAEENEKTEETKPTEVKNTEVKKAEVKKAEDKPETSESESVKSEVSESESEVPTKPEPAKRKRKPKSEAASASESDETANESESSAETESETVEKASESEDSQADTSETDATDSVESQAKTEEPESLTESEPASESESASESTSEATEESEAQTSEVADDDDGELVLLDLSDYKRAIRKTPNKPARKKTSRAKAKDLLSKADENMREDKK